MAVTLLARGKGDYGKRAYAAARQVIDISPEAFPTDLQPHLATIKRLVAGAADEWSLPLSGLRALRPSERDAFTDAILRLYEAAATDRAKGP